MTSSQPQKEILAHISQEQTEEAYKSQQEYRQFNNMTYKMELTDIYRKFYSKTAEYKLSSSDFELFTK